MTVVGDRQWHDLLHTRATRPDAVARAYAGRRRPDLLLSAGGTLFLVAADHPAGGSLACGGDALAIGRQDAVAHRRLRPRHGVHIGVLRPGGERPGVPGLLGMVEPLPYYRDAAGRLVLRKGAASLARAVTIASGLGVTSAFTWLKVPSCDDPGTVYAATTLPCVVLGGVPSADLAADLASCAQTLRRPVVRGRRR
jgi:hypothetical protein